MPKKKTKPALPLQGPKSNEVPTSSETKDIEEDLAESYELELCWCIQQIKLTITNCKTSSKQIEENKSILKTLLSTKAPVVKKRMLMRKTFGDYRKQMNEERLKIEKEFQKMKIAPADPHKSVYIKKADIKTKPDKSVKFCFNFPDPD